MAIALDSGDTVLDGGKSLASESLVVGLELFDRPLDADGPGELLGEGFGLGVGCEVVEELENLKNDGLVIRSDTDKILWIEVDVDAEGPASVECGNAVLGVVAPVPAIVVEDIWAEVVDETTEAEAGAPAGGEVCDVDVVIFGGVLLAPDEKGISCSSLFDGDVVDEELVDDGPDETEGQLDIAVDDVLRADGDEPDLLDIGDVADSDGAVFEHLNAHLRVLVPAFCNWLLTDDLEKLDELNTVGEFLGDVLAALTDSLQVLIGPPGE